MSTGTQAQINVTPLIDVLLVLLIIFMVIVPTTSTGLDTHVPQPALDSPQPAAPVPPLIVSIGPDRVIHLNSERLELAALGDRLREVLVMRPNEPLFVQGAPQLDFDDVAQVIDVARGAGMANIGLLTKPVGELAMRSPH